MSSETYLSDLKTEAQGEVLMEHLKPQLSGRPGGGSVGKVAAVYAEGPVWIPSTHVKTELRAATPELGEEWS